MGDTPSRDCPTCGLRLSALRWEGEVEGYACGHCKLFYNHLGAAPAPLRVEGVEYFDEEGGADCIADADSGDSFH